MLGLFTIILVLLAKNFSGNVFVLWLLLCACRSFAWRRTKMIHSASSSLKRFWCVVFLPTISNTFTLPFCLIIIFLHWGRVGTPLLVLDDSCLLGKGKGFADICAFICKQHELIILNPYFQNLVFLYFSTEQITKMLCMWLTVQYSWFWLMQKM